MSTKVYDSNQVTVIFGGYPISSGRADGEFVKIMKTTPTYSTKVGADGEVTRIRSNDGRVNVELTLTQTSTANDVLDAFLTADKVATNGISILPLYIRDHNGLTVFAAGQAWITGEPEVSFGKEDANRVWKLEASDSLSHIGGSLDI